MPQKSTRASKMADRYVSYVGFANKVVSMSSALYTRMSRTHVLSNFNDDERQIHFFKNFGLF